MGVRRGRGRGRGGRGMRLETVGGKANCCFSRRSTRAYITIYTYINIYPPVYINFYTYIQFYIYIYAVHKRGNFVATFIRDFRTIREFRYVGIEYINIPTCTIGIDVKKVQPCIYEIAIFSVFTK